MCLLEVLYQKKTNSRTANTRTDETRWKISYREMNTAQKSFSATSTLQKRQSFFRMEPILSSEIGSTAGSMDNTQLPHNTVNSTRIPVIS